VYTTYPDSVVSCVANFFDLPSTSPVYDMTRTFRTRRNGGNYEYHGPRIHVDQQNTIVTAIPNSNLLRVEVHEEYVAVDESHLSLSLSLSLSYLISHISYLISHISRRLFDKYVLVDIRTWTTTTGSFAGLS